MHMGKQSTKKAEKSVTSECCGRAKGTIRPSRKGPAVHSIRGNRDEAVSIRPAQTGDLELVIRLLDSLHLPVRGVEEHFQDFIVMVRGQETVGVVGMEIYGKQALLRSLGVARECQGHGYGKQLCRSILDRMSKRGIGEAYLLTQTAESFFATFGFEAVSRDRVVGKVKSSSEFQSVCPSSAVCMRLRVK
jgi:amino-acid N-acetyltransferase